MSRKTRQGTVVQLRAMTQAEQVEELDERVEQARADARLMEDVAAEAREAGSYGPTASAVRALPGLRAMEIRLEAARQGELAANARERIRIYRAAAATEGSWTAVASLTQQEREIEREDEAKRAAEEERARLTADPAAVLSQLEGALRQLPDAVAIDLRERLRWT